jgi:hypothetical protein
MALSDLALGALSLQQLFEAVASANVGTAVSGFTQPAAGIGAQDLALGMFETEFNYTKAADDAGAGNISLEVSAGSVPKRSMLVAAQIVPNNATGLTAVTANYAVIAINARSTTLGTAKSLGVTNTLPTANGGTGSWTQWNGVNMNVTAFDPVNTVLNAGDAVTFGIGKVGSGVTVPGFTITFRLRYV